MISTSPRHARHARVAPGRATGAPGREAAEGLAGPRRRRRIRLLLIVAPVTAVLVAVGLVGMHIVTWPVHLTADTSRQHAGTDVVNALPAALSCCRFSSITPAATSPSASPRHHAAKPSVAPRHHPTVKATPSASGGTGGDGTSAPGSVAGWRLTYSTDFPGNSLPDGWLAYNGQPGGDPYGNWQPSNVSVSGGALHLMATSSAQGGVKFLGNPQTYGMYLVRMKGDYEPGLSINNLAILWPPRTVFWPPEVDFFEDLGGSRQYFLRQPARGPGRERQLLRHRHFQPGQQRHGVAHLRRAVDAERDNLHDRRPGLGQHVPRFAQLPRSMAHHSHGPDPAVPKPGLGAA